MSQEPARIKAVDPQTIGIDEAINPFVRRAVIYWRSVCGERRFPARADLTLRGMAAILPYCVIIRVIDDGADFEYRYVGDAQRQAFKASFKGLLLSQIEAGAPQLGAVLRGAYEHVRAHGLPYIVRGQIDHDPADPAMLYHESLFLPLGAGDAAVDHILIVGVQIPEPFWDISADKLSGISNQIRDALLNATSATAP